MPFSVGAVQINQICVLSLEGELCYPDASHLVDVLRQQQAQGMRRFVLDLSTVEYLDADGIRAILAVLRESSAAGGEVTFVINTYAVRRVLEITKILPHLRSGANREEAIALLERPAG